jgi:hypothetical protein
MENLYYLPISLVENVLFEQPENGIALVDTNGVQHLLEFSNLELQKYYQHYYIDIQSNSNGVNEVGDDYKIPIGIDFSSKQGIKLMPFEEFKKEFDMSLLAKIDSLLLEIDGEEVEFIIVTIKKQMIEEALFVNENISINLGKVGNIDLTTINLTKIYSSVSSYDNATLAFIQTESNDLELFGLLLEPDFDNPNRDQLTLKKL